MFCASVKSTYYKNSFNIAVVAAFFGTILKEAPIRQFKLRILTGEQSSMAGFRGLAAFHFNIFIILGIRY